MKSTRRILLLLFACSIIPLLPFMATAQDTTIYESIEQQMQDIRDLDLLEPLEITFMTREQYLAFVQAGNSVSEEDDALGLDDQRVMIAFGLIEEGQDPSELVAALLGEQVLGFYDAETQQMVIILTDDRAEPSAIAQATFAHETVHAIQDQHFNLESLNDIRLNGTTDSYLAVTGLIEGDATLAQTNFLMQHPALVVRFMGELQEQTSGNSILDSTPAYFVALLTFPYSEGYSFVEAVFEEGGWDRVNQVYEDPPTTTEQVLHPEKYFAGEGAVEIDLPDTANTLGPEWRVIGMDSFGEYLISVFLQDSGLSARQITLAHEGWGGDAWVALTDGSQTVVAWQTVWDTTRDADEFLRALAVRESRRLEARIDRHDGSIVIDGNGTVVQIQQSDDTIVWFSGPDLATVEAIAALFDQ